MVKNEDKFWVIKMECFYFIEKMEEVNIVGYLLDIRFCDGGYVYVILLRFYIYR